jgi:hypothetical protein
MTTADEAGLIVSGLYRGQRRRRPLRAPPVDPFEQHRQLRPRQRHRPAVSLRPHETSTLEPLRQQAQPVAPRHSTLSRSPNQTTFRIPIARRC